jgi:2-keto-3-deoxy-L-rhamnonate aldolase RhmA
MLIVVMIETPVGVANAYDIARTPGVDVALAANTDLGNFSGYAPESPEYNDLVKRSTTRRSKPGSSWGRPSQTTGRAGRIAKILGCSRTGHPSMAGNLRNRRV